MRIKILEAKGEYADSQIWVAADEVQSNELSKSARIRYFGFPSSKSEGVARENDGMFYEENRSEQEDEQR